MGDVNQILERIESKAPPSGGKGRDGDKRPQLEWQDVVVKSVPVGERSTNVKVAKRGAVFGISFCNADGRPTSASGNATDLLAAKDAILAEVSAAFDRVAEEDAKFQKFRAEREKKQNGGGFGGPAVVRATGKTERERQKKLGKHKPEG